MGDFTSTNFPPKAITFCANVLPLVLIKALLLVLSVVFLPKLVSTSSIAFTFNVDKDSSHFERTWNWHPKTNDVILISGNDTILYNRKHIDSISTNADKAFINDKYWLLAPFQLIWDQGTSISEAIKEEAPISKNILNKITLTYSSEGGYTPGDA